MEQLNRIELRGVVGNARVQNAGGRKVYHFNVATSRAYKDRSGNAVIETTWHHVVAWDGDNFQDLDKVEKGTKLYVSGRLRNQKYTGNDETERYAVEVVANRVVLVDSDESLSYEM
ncbi:MAG: single-stranded DNA-binding protein [Candidatus Cryptobacteroides sp.]